MHANYQTGMTRHALLTVFAREGGLSTGLRRTFVSRDCPYFKVDVDFKAVGRPDRDRQGRVTLVEDDRDLIVKIPPRRRNLWVNIPQKPALNFTAAVVDSGFRDVAVI
ncbi:MAG: hypothetical protein WDO73_21310 [Ignavibacteriota bacterium]